MTALRVAAVQYPIERLPNLDAWRDKQERIVAEACDRGARLVVLPEYAPMELTAVLAPEHQSALDVQLRELQALWPAVFACHAALAAKHGVWLLGGSVPESVTGADGHTEVRNRARFYAPRGEPCVQEKLQMTRFEREQWGISPGHESVVVDTPFGVLGIAICYDSEFPLIVRRLVEAGANLILVPSCTDGLAGYHRVSVSCRARAMENQCYVVQAVTVGEAPWSLALDDNHGAAGVFTPIDHGFPADGVLALGPIDREAIVLADLDFDALARVRADGQVKNHADWNAANHMSTPLVRRDLR